MVSIDRLIDEAWNYPVSGWDFSYLEGRLLEDRLPWNFQVELQMCMQSASSMLDLCTGGGEFLSALPNRPAKVTATEGYEPNVAVARSRLQSLGIEVVQTGDNLKIPLPDRRYDLMLSRHGAYDVSEVKRLASGVGAVFLTQQVGSDNARTINAMLDDPSTEPPNWDLSGATHALKNLGFSIVQARQARPNMMFLDIGALVYYLRMVSWQVPDFHPGTYRNKLAGAARTIEKEGGLSVPTHRFLIQASLTSL